MDASTTAHVKVSAAWFGVVYGAVTSLPLSQWVLYATLIFTVLQSAKLIRDWVVSRRDRAEAKAKELLADARIEAKALLETARKAAE